MKHTLLLRLAGPMQSWGIQSDFGHRDSGLEPSKSGVVGLLCAALGKPRDESHPNNRGKPLLTDLAQLRMGVRVDREGGVLYDFHTALDVMKADGTRPSYDKHPKFTAISKRYYLSDAAFLVGFEGEDITMLAKLHDAVRHPRWPLALGRKAFVPGEPILLKDGLREDSSLEDALRAFPRLKPKCHVYDDDLMRLVIENRTRGVIERNDQPLSFVKGLRKFDIRRVYSDYCDDQPLLNDLEA